MVASCWHPSTALRYVFAMRMEDSVTVPLASWSPPPADTEAEAAVSDALLGLCRNKTGAIPASVLVGHALAITKGADWPVQRAAMEALLRRLESVEQDRLRIATRPAHGRVLGRYQTRRGGRGGGLCPYTTQLEGVAPLVVRCDCPDYAKNSLGLCKHALTVLREVYRHPRKLKVALREQLARHPSRLVFEPIRPLVGAGDPLMQVHWECGSAVEHTLAGRRARRWFVAGQAGTLPLKAAYAEEPRRRLALIKDLLAFRESPSAEDPDPALPGLLLEERERLERVLRDAPLVADLKSQLTTLRCPLYPYQVEGVSRFLSTGRLLLADDMGLGKTAQAIAACQVLWQTGRVRRGLLIVPASLKPQWRREWQHFSGAPVSVVEGGPAERAAAYARGDAGFLIVNYEQVLRDLPLLQKLELDVIVLDEAQRIKNWATKTAASVKTLSAPYRLVLTGTPMENRLTELASILDWIEPRALEPKWRLVPWHTYTDANGGSGARNLDTLRLRLSRFTLRRVRQEVLPQLPARTDTRVPVELTAEQREQHDALNQPIAQLAAILRQRPLSPAQHLRLMRLLTTQRIVSNGLAQLQFLSVWPSIRHADPTPALRHGLFSPKLEALRELITHLVVEQGRKVVVFSQWRRMLQLAEWALRDLLAESSARAVYFTGAEPAARRAQNMTDFHEDARTQVMLLTDAGGVGLNLQRAASACINLELPWNPAVLEQRISRIYRIGQEQPIDVYNLVSEEGIEARIADLLGNKRALFAGLFDGTSNELRFEQAGSFWAKIEHLLPEPAPAPAAVGEPDDGGEAAQADGELTELLDAADEALDQEAPGAAAIREPVQPERREASAPPAGEQSAVDPSARPISAGAVRSLFGEIRVRKTDAGGLSIEASPAAAGTLAALLKGLAGLLTEADQSP
jgi:hypothetical protein